MDCFLDGVKSAGRVEMASGLAGYVNSFFGDNENENEKPDADMNKKPLTFQDFYDALNKVFYGKDDGIQYRYHLDMNNLRNATLSDIVIDINVVEGRARSGNTPNQIPANRSANPSILIKREPVTKANGVVNDKVQIIELINRLSTFKQFIIEKFNSGVEQKTRLRDLLQHKIISRAPVTPRRSGGRRTKRAKRSKHTKHSKRSKHTRRRKH